MVRTKINLRKNNQYVTTVPKVLAEAFTIKKGDKLEWSSQGSDLLVRIIRK